VAQPPAAAKPGEPARPASRSPDAPGPAAQVEASFTLHGAGVSGGIAIGYAHLITTARREVAHYDVPADEIETEIQRFDDAIAKFAARLIGLQASVPPTAPAEMSAFLTCT